VAGARIGPYRLVKPLGRGGQGEVFLADDLRFQRRVAVKVLSGLVGSAGERALERFRREGALASRINHPAICPVYSMDTEGGTPYLVMAHVEGETLREKIRAAGAGRSDASRSSGIRLSGTSRRPRDEVRDVVSLFETAARALHAAHEAGILHRDIKPGNIMVNPGGEPVLMDFGLALDLEEAENTDGARGGDGVLGTLPYMASEQLERADLDRRADVYSLGVTLFECLTLELPFAAGSPEAMLRAVLAGETRDVRRINPAVSRDLGVVLATTLERHRSRRYQTALDLAEDLRRVRELEPIEARPPGLVTRFHRWASRNPALAASGVGVFAILVVSLAVILVLLQRTRRESRAKEALVNEKKSALEQITRLADSRRLVSLLNEAETLWPPRPERIPDLEGWLRRARRLFDRLPRHRIALEALRRQGRVLPDGGSSRQAFARWNDRARLELTRRRRAALRSGDLDGRDLMLKNLDRRIRRLEQRIACDETLVFDDPHESWRHAALTVLVADLAQFEETIESVKQRLEFARTVETRSIREQGRDWEACLAELADPAAAPAYRGLRMPPQLGLIPLGRDPESGLFEFAHLQSGRPARRDPESHRLVIRAETGIVLVLLPGGIARLGAGPDDPNARPFESLVHDVALDPFFLAKTEMTQAQWLRTMGDNPSASSPEPGRTGQTITLIHPVERVSWDLANRCLARLDLALPTEAQWEYACRAGSNTIWQQSDSPASLIGSANIAGEECRGLLDPRMIQPGHRDGHVGHAPVASYAPNRDGLFDMHGNVSEWCRDWFVYYGGEVDPGDGLRRGGKKVARIIRGGSFRFPARHSRSAHRAFNNTWSVWPDTGVRPARPIHGLGKE